MLQQLFAPQLVVLYVLVASTLYVHFRGRELPVGYGPGEVHPDGKRTGELLKEGARWPNRT